MNKTSGDDGIPGELFKILKYDAVQGLHQTWQQILKTQQWSQKSKMSVFIPIPKKGHAKEISNCNTIPFISHASKIMPRILQAQLKNYLNQELPDVQDGFRKIRETRDQSTKIHWITEKARGFQKNTYFCFIDYTKAFHNVDHNKLPKTRKEKGMQDHPTFLLRNMHAGLEGKRQKPDMQQWSGSKFGKEYVKVVDCHSAHLTYMQNISCEILNCVNSSWNQDCQEKYQ